jgi:hypothetical protein
MNVSKRIDTKEEVLQGLNNKFCEWRKSKKSSKDRIPEELWAEAVKLAQKDSVFRVSQKLRLSYIDLKKRMGKSNREGMRRSNEEGDFMELKVSAPTHPFLREATSHCIMELIRGDGAQLKVYSTHGATIDITRICESFAKN